MFLLGKCHLDVGHRGSRSPSRSKFNHIASPGPTLTLISPWLVQEYDLPCFSPGTLLVAPWLWPRRAISQQHPHTPTDLKLKISPTTHQIYSRFARHVGLQECLASGDAIEMCTYRDMVRSVGWAVTWCRPVPPVGLPQIMAEWPDWFKQPSHLNYLLRV